MSSSALHPINPAWRKSSHSGSGNACVEVADLEDAGIAVRDSTDPSGPRLAFTHAAFAAFSTAVRQGTYDLTPIH